jgi:hypothetical protein
MNFSPSPSEGERGERFVAPLAIQGFKTANLFRGIFSLALFSPERPSV